MCVLDDLLIRCLDDKICYNDPYIEDMLGKDDVLVIELACFLADLATTVNTW